MKLKSLLLTSALALSSVAVLSAKSYDILLSSPSIAGTMQLPKGEYKVKVEGTNAIFTSVDNGKKFTAPVKVSTAAKKFQETAVEATDQNGTSKIKAIDLGGSTTQLDFGGD
jgi:hypothetical protein